MPRPRLYEVLNPNWLTERVVQTEAANLPVLGRRSVEMPALGFQVGVESEKQRVVLYEVTHSGITVIVK